MKKQDYGLWAQTTDKKWHKLNATIKLKQKATITLDGIKLYHYLPLSLEQDISSLVPSIAIIKENITEYIKPRIQTIINMLERFPGREDKKQRCKQILKELS